MALKFTQRREEEVPGRQGKPNEELEQMKAELSKLRAGMVLEIDSGEASAVRRTKGLVTRASKQLDRPFQHWSEGAKVYAKPVDETRRRGRPRKSEQQ